MRKKIWVAFVIALLVTVMFGCKPKERIVTFYDGETEVKRIAVKEKTPIELPIAPNKDGYTFDGWFIDNGEWKVPFGEDYFVKNKVKNDISVYAKYTKIIRYVTISYETGIEDVDCPNETCEKGEFFTPPIPMVDEYNFYDWCVDEARLIPFTQGVANQNMTLYGKFVAKDVEKRQEVSVTVRYNNATNEKKELKIRQGEKFSQEEPLFVGYKFAGYYIDKDFNGKYDENTIITHSFTLYVKWLKMTEKYSVVFNVNGGSEIDSYKNVPYNSLLREPPQPERGGYAFAGWYRNEILFDFSSFRVTENIELVAAWDLAEKPRYVVTYVFNNGEENISQDYTVGDPPSLISPQKENAIFDGWYTEAELVNRYDSKAEEKGFTLYAKWIEMTTNEDFVLQSGGVNDGFVITKYIGEEVEVVIPYTIDGKKVTEIGAKAFANSSVEKITLPEGMLIIGEEAFAECKKLIEINASGTPQLKQINDKAFYLSTLKWFSVRSALKLIGKSAFEKTLLEEVTISGESDAKVEERAFYHCKNLTKITVNGFEEIGQAAFYECQKLEEVKANDCKKIGVQAFYSCINMSSVEIKACTNLGEQAFLGNIQLKTVLTENLQNIAAKAFMNAANITELNLEKVRTIGDWAFMSCSFLSSIKLGAAFESISPYSFENAPKISFSITQNPKYSAVDGSLIKDGNKLYCAGAVKDRTYTIPKGVSSACNEAFQPSNAIEKLIITSDFEEFGDIYGCVNLDNVKEFALVQNSVFSIKNGNLYKGNVLLRYVDMQDKTSFTIDADTEIGNGAFFGCEYLTELIVGEGVEEIGDSAFYNCASLTTVVGAEGIKKYGRTCFYMCTNLTQINISSSAIIGEWAFEGTKISVD